jgi:hypothetical protein
VIVEIGFKLQDSIRLLDAAYSGFNSVKTHDTSPRISLCEAWLLGRRVYTEGFFLTEESR